MKNPFKACPVCEGVGFTTLPDGKKIICGNCSGSGLVKAEEEPIVSNDHEGKSDTK